MKKKKCEFINTSKRLQCWGCDGWGMTNTVKAMVGKEKVKKCKICNGTGVFIETHYMLVAEDKNGKKIAFSVDSIK
jgi:hypothetical protein